MSSSEGHRFQKHRRLLDAAAFGRVFKKATRSRDKLFTVLCRDSDRGDDNGSAKLGMAISKKHCRLATGRNRIKRTIRESFRQRPELLSGLDIIVMNQPAAAKADAAELRASLERHWRRIARDQGKQKHQGQQE